MACLHLDGLGSHAPGHEAFEIRIYGAVFRRDGIEARLRSVAFLRDFAGDLPEAKARVLYAVQVPFHRALLTGKTTQAAWPH